MCYVSGVNQKPRAVFGWPAAMHQGVGGGRGQCRPDLSEKRQLLHVDRGCTRQGAQDKGIILLSDSWTMLASWPDKVRSPLPSVAEASRRCLIDQTIGNKIAQQQMISNKCRMSLCDRQQPTWFTTTGQMPFDKNATVSRWPVVWLTHVAQPWEPWFSSSVTARAMLLMTYSIRDKSRRLARLASEHCTHNARTHALCERGDHIYSGTAPVVAG